MKASIALFAASAMAYAVSAPAAFTIQVTVPSIGSYYLEKGATGYGTKDLANAAKCAINPKTELVCDGVTVGTAYLNDMVPLTKNFGQNITTGFSVDDKDGIHWKNEGFRLQKVIVEKQGGEAKWALYPKNNGKYQLYAQLGCPNTASEEHSFHQMMAIGEGRVVKL